MPNPPTFKDLQRVRKATRETEPLPTRLNPPTEDDLERFMNLTFKRRRVQGHTVFVEDEETPIDSNLFYFETEVNFQGTGDNLISEGGLFYILENYTGESTPSTPDDTGIASYTLTSNYDYISEGSSFTIILNTTNVDEGSLIPYTITGVSSADISGSSLTGNFSISNNVAYLTLTLAADSSTEGTEYLKLTLDQVADTSITITIVDSSTDGGGGDPDPDPGY
jgi:hypothetical protein